MSKIHLLWGVNGTRDIVLRNELAALQQQYPGRLDITYIVSGPEAKPDAPSLPANGSAERYRKGYIDESVLREVIQRCESEGRSMGDGKTQAWLCGPPKMEDAIAPKKGKSILAQLGIGKVHKF